MSVYDRDWYRKENERRQRRQEGTDAMWSEVEPPRRTKKPGASQNRQTASPKPSDKLIPSCCPLCEYTTQLRVPYQQLRAYTYTCPACKTKISVVTGENRDKKTSTIFTILGILALLVYTLSQWSNIAGLFM